MIPASSWFLQQPPSQLHGIGHSARVMVWASVLTAATDLFETAVWAAACHDLRRENDGKDEEHGVRAGEWVRKELPGLVSVAPRELERIATACQWHATPDAHIPSDDPLIGWLKDADALDRARLGDLDPKMLRHRETHELIEAADSLYGLTEMLEDPMRVFEAAEVIDVDVRELRRLVGSIRRTPGVRA